MSYALIIEDDEAIAEVLESMLHLLEWRTKVVHNARSAFTVLNQEIPDVIILDLYMPIASGLEVCHFVRQNSHMRSTPIIMVTADGTIQSREAALRAGVTEYLVKPVDFDEIEAVLMRVMA